MLGRVVRACIAGIALSAGIAHAQRPSPQELGALSHVQSAFLTGMDAGVMAPTVALGPELERRFGMPSGTSGARVYRAVLALMGEGAIAVRPATQQQASGYGPRPGFNPAGSPVFVLAGAAGTQLLVQYELRDSRISFVGQLGVAEPAPPPAPVAKPEPVPVAIAEPRRPVPLAWTVQFEYKSMELSKPALVALEGDLAPRLAADANRRFRLSAHTDGIGSAQYNEGLSRKRADAVRAYLVAKGVRAENIEVAIRGAAVPVKACDGQKSTKAKRACLAPNRRVVIEAL